MMKILITGGAGLVGSHCAEFYAKRKAQVIILDNLMRSELFKSKKQSVEYNWHYLGKFKNIKRIKGDVRSEKDVKYAIGTGVDAVIHTAGQPGVPSSVRMPREDFNINAFGTLNVLEVLRKKNKKAAFVYCSTNKVYGENVDELALKSLETRYEYKNTKGIDEKMPTDLTGHTPYGVSKLVGDLYAQEYAHIYGMKTAVFRMGCIYGERQFGFEDQGWVAWFIIACLLGKKITIYGDGKQVRDLLYAGDLVCAFDKFIQGKKQHLLVNVGGGKSNSISLLEFLSKLETLTGNRPKFSFSDWRPSDQKVYITNIEKIRKELLWRPKISVYEGLRRLSEWIANNRNIF